MSSSFETGILFHRMKFFTLHSVSQQVCLLEYDSFSRIPLIDYCRVRYSLHPTFVSLILSWSSWSSLWWWCCQRLNRRQRLIMYSSSLLPIHVPLCLFFTRRENQLRYESWVKMNNLKSSSQSVRRCIACLLLHNIFLSCFPFCSSVLSFLLALQHFSHLFYVYPCKIFKLNILHYIFLHLHSSLPLKGRKKEESCSKCSRFRLQDIFIIITFSSLFSFEKSSSHSFFTFFEQKHTFEKKCKRDVFCLILKDSEEDEEVKKKLYKRPGQKKRRLWSRVKQKWNAYCFCFDSVISLLSPFDAFSRHEKRRKEKGSEKQIETEKKKIPRKDLRKKKTDEYRWRESQYSLRSDSLIKKRMRSMIFPSFVARKTNNKRGKKCKGFIHEETRWEKKDASVIHPSTSEARRRRSITWRFISEQDELHGECIPPKIPSSWAFPLYSSWQHFFFTRLFLGLLFFSITSFFTWLGQEIPVASLPYFFLS